MKSFFQIIFFTILATAFFSCKQKSAKKENIEDWYNRIKNEILENSKQKEDSISYKRHEETLFITYFLKNRKLRQELRSPDTTRLFAIIKYGQNDLFELRNEVYKNGQNAMEGIVYNDNYYGPWIVWYETGQIMHKGYRYENIDFGNWIYYTEKGEVEKNNDNKNLFYLDSILSKKDLQTSLVQLN